MLAAVRGIAIEPEVAQISVIRSGDSSRVWFLDLFEHPESDIALRGGNRILGQADTRPYTVPDAAVKQARVA